MVSVLKVACVKLEQCVILIHNCTLLNKGQSFVTLICCLVLFFGAISHARLVTNTIVSTWQTVLVTELENTVTNSKSAVRTS